MTRQRTSRTARRWRAAASPEPVTAHANAVAWARALLNDPDTLFLDTETTDLPPAAEVIDLAVVNATGTVLVDTLIRPSMPIPPETTAVHGICDDDVAAAPSWIEVHELLAEALAGRTVVIYNLRFDFRVLTDCSQRYRLSLPRARWECAMLAYADYRGERGRKGGQFRWHKLEQAAGHFGYPPGGHRALPDALTCLQVVRGMAGTV
jgi:DNA polymerase-3 subunit epsilon